VKIQCGKDGCYKMLDAQKVLDGIFNVKTSSLLPQQEKNLQEQQKLLLDKLNALKIARTNETQADIKFQLDQQIKEATKMLKQLEKR
jgi:hypothetical protein